MAIDTACINVLDHFCSEMCDICGMTMEGDVWLKETITYVAIKRHEQQIIYLIDHFKIKMTDLLDISLHNSLLMNTTGVYVSKEV